MAINRDVKVKASINIFISEVNDENNPVDRGGREGRTKKGKVVDIPEMTLDYDELYHRFDDLADVIQHGYELTGTEPPEAVTEEPSGVTTTAVTLHGRVLPNTNTSCGFMFGTTKELTTTHDADQSIIAAASDTPVPITHTVLGLTANTRYYFRAWAQIALVRTRYGRIRSFKTLSA